MTMLERRPSVNPGSFKTRVNQAGGTVFVHPDLTIRWRPACGRSRAAATRGR
jgi:hypothetical protein